MSFKHTHGQYNVETTINRWFETNITAQGVPNWMPSARVLFNFPEANLIDGHSGHAFTVTHLGAEALDGYQGRNADGRIGIPKQGIVEANIWVSKKAAGGSVVQWSKQCGDMISYLFTSARETEIVDAYGDNNNPTGIGAIVRFHTPEQPPVVNPDSDNPDLFRRRYLLRYNWIERF